MNRSFMAFVGFYSRARHIHHFCSPSLLFAGHRALAPCPALVHIFRPSAVGSITSDVGSLLCGYGFGVFCALRSMPNHMIASSTLVMARLRSRELRTG